MALNEQVTDLTPNRARVILALLMFFAFAPFMHAELFWDDFRVIRADGPIAHLSTISTAFTGRCVLFPPGVEYPYYRPFIDILFVLEYAIGGTSAFIYHLTNFLLHLANSMMLLALAMRIPSRAPNLVALFGTVLFALHPIQVESVLWAAARPAVLSTFFCLIGLHCAAYVWRGNASPGRLMLAGIGATLGLLAGIFSKEVAILAVPAAAPMLVLRGSRPTRRAVALFAATGLLVAVYLVLNRTGTSSGTETLRLSGLPMLAHQLCEFFGFYIAKLLVPHNLYPSYSLGAHQTTAFFALGLTALLGCAAACVPALRVRNVRACIFVSAMVLFVGGTLLAHLAGQALVADRYVYQALVGLAFVVVCGLGALLDRGKIHPPALAKAAVLLLLILTGRSLQQSFLWLTEEGMWRYVVSVEPANLKGATFVAVKELERGNLEGGEKHLLAVVEAESSGQLPPRFNSAKRLGQLYMQQERFAEAARMFAFAAQFPPLTSSANAARLNAEWGAGNPERAASVYATLAGVQNLNGWDCAEVARYLVRSNGDLTAAKSWYGRALERGFPGDPELAEKLGGPPAP
jgi:hypothetical protein